MSSPAFHTTFDFPATLKAARDRAVLTQKELAERLEVSERTIQGWEGGTAFPRPSQRRRVFAFIAETDEQVA